ncbi:ankyrin repeat-containing protein BDA1-like protein [Cinnamomum micranthum f. kanehirae]|uniref:Ankyrin repeat-containing protein BDA1-like protein n=1 Tax=Cinnamomum micranthum f. kanehirae TaxID=337451 RepID=A0A443PUV3_9MAGN|nr:ankyrin repeat-containing protein BDA1-like protein [Cinnamomum micranthum f. kanehirae]
MDRRLHKAAISGDVPLLHDLLQQDEHILGEVKVMHDPIDHENPLHVAAQFGHVDFAREILSRKPEYAHELNSQGQSPLHLASGARHLEVVKLLLEKDATVCFVRDKRGRTPLHIAARKGRVKVLKELVLAEPTAAWIQTEQGEPILHLCASNGQFEALETLVRLISSDDFVNIHDFVNMKDDEDNSILHLLALKIQTEVIMILLSNGRLKLDINCLNMKKDTPLDVLVKVPRSSGYKICKKELRRAGGKRAKELPQAPATTHPKNTWKAHANWLSETKGTLIVVAVLMVTVSFQAAINPPGGVWQDDYPPYLSPGENKTEIDQWYKNFYYDIEPNMHYAGEAVMSSESPVEYLLFTVCNLISLLSSTNIILLLISGFNIKRRWVMWVLMIAMWISICSMGCSFCVCFYYLANDNVLAYVRLQNTSKWPYVISILPALALIGPLVTAHLVRLVIRLYKKFKRRADSAGNREGAAIHVSIDPSTPT